MMAASKSPTKNVQRTRENWLQDAVEQLKPIFSIQGYQVPDVQVSIGFTSRGMHSNHVGQCWSQAQARDELNHIFLVPNIDDPVEILDTLVHELVHAVDDCRSGHGRPFKKIATRIGLEGPMRNAHANKALRMKLAEIAQFLGPLPHAALIPQPRRRVSFTRPKARCSQCDYEVPMLKRFLEYGPPLCPVHKTPMAELGDWDME